MSTETTKKKIKIDNGTNFAKAYTDKAIDAKLPTDLGASATNLHLLAGATKLGSGINLSGFEYDEATKTLKASGGGGGGVSPILVLTNVEDGSTRTSITEEEKTNIESGMYNSVLYIDSSLGNAGFYAVYFPETATTMEGCLLFSTYSFSVEEETTDIKVLGSLTYAVLIGAKSSDGTYPITIEKQFEVPFSGGSAGPSLPEITANDEGKALVVIDGNAQWTTIESGTSYPIELQLDATKSDFGLGEYANKPGVYILSSPNNGSIYEWKANVEGETITTSYNRALLYGVLTKPDTGSTTPNLTGELYLFDSATANKFTFLGSGDKFLERTSGQDYKIVDTLTTVVGISFMSGIAGSVPLAGILGPQNTNSDDLKKIMLSPYCVLRYDFKKTSSTTDSEKVAHNFFGRIDYGGYIDPTTLTLIGMFDGKLGKAVLEKNASGVFESKTPIEYVADVNAVTYSKARYKHTVTLKTSAGAILWTQTLSNSKNTPVNSYNDLKTLFGGELLAGYGEYAQLDLRGGTEATDKLIKLDGTEATIESLGAIVYTDVCFLPK